MRSFISLLILNTISIVLYRDWFTFKILSYGDYVYYFRETLLSYSPFSVWQSTFNFGAMDVVFYRLPLYVSYVFGAESGFEFSALDRFLVMWPWVFLSVTSIYLLLSLFIKSEKARVVGSLFFAFNTYFISISSQGHLLISVGVCFGLFSLFTYIKLVQTKKILYLLLTSFFVFLISIYDLRVWYIFSAIIFFYLIFVSLVSKYNKKEILRLFVNYLEIYLIVFLLSSYWILPYTQVGSSLSQEILNRDLFGNEFINILYSITLFHPFWTGLEPAWFEIQKINPFFWSIPILVFAGFILNRKNKHALFFTLLALLGVFLTKQSSTPFIGSYEWLFNNFPGFSGFRESSKFYSLIAISYAALISFLIDYFNSRNSKYSVKIKWIVILTVILITAWTAKPLFTKEIGALLVERTINNDYFVLNDFIKKQEEFFRVGWFPRPSKWHIASTRHPQVSMMDVINNQWKEYRDPELVDLYGKGKVSAVNVGIDFFNSNDASSLISANSIKYVVVPIRDRRNSDDIYQFFGGTDKEVYESLKQLPYMEELDINLTRLKVFQNLEYSPHFYLSNTPEGNSKSSGIVTSESMSPSHYRIRLSNLPEDSYLFFSEAYNYDWNIRFENWNWLDEVGGGKDKIEPSESKSGTNYYYLQVEDVCSRIKCQFSGEGTSFSLDLYYRPQAYFVAGSIVSISSILILSLCFVLLLIKNQYEKNKK